MLIKSKSPYYSNWISNKLLLHFYMCKNKKYIIFEIKTNTLALLSWKQQKCNFMKEIQFFDER